LLTSATTATKLAFGTPLGKKLNLELIKILEIMPNIDYNNCIVVSNVVNIEH